MGRDKLWNPGFVGHLLYNPLDSPDGHAGAIVSGKVILNEPPLLPYDVTFLRLANSLTLRPVSRRVQMTNFSLKVSQALVSRLTSSSLNGSRLYW